LLRVQALAEIVQPDGGSNHARFYFELHVRYRLGDRLKLHATVDYGSCQGKNSS
jgi:hypothetical protein